MTSEIGVEGQRLFHVHCRCGAAISTSDKQAICPDCGETVEVMRCVSTRNGKKYCLRISNRRRNWNPAPLAWVPPRAMPLNPRPFKTPDPSKRYLRLGLAILWHRFICPSCWLFSAYCSLRRWSTEVLPRQELSRCLSRRIAGGSRAATMRDRSRRSIASVATTRS